MKITIQEKIAELESRIAALEKARTATTKTTITTKVSQVDLEPEFGGIFKQMNALFEKLKF